MIRVYQAWELFQRKISEIQRGLAEWFPQNNSHPPPIKSRSWTAASWNCMPMHFFFTSSQTFTSSSTNPASSGTWPPLSHWRVCHHLGLFSNYNIKNKIKTLQRLQTNIEFQVSCWLFTSPTRPIQLPFTNSHFRFLALLQSSNFSLQLTTQATDMVNLSLSKLLECSPFFVKTWHRNDCIQH